jgi:predicted deacylase
MTEPVNVTPPAPVTPQAMPAPPPALPIFPVEITVPDLAPWRAGNTGIPGFTSFAGTAPGPHIALVALMHGNEISGAIVLDRLLRQNPSPLRGRLTIGFLNLAAFDRFDPAQPTASRYVDEDLNRLWDVAVLDGPRHSHELDLARAVRPLIDEVDMLVDLHSMLWPSDPLILSGPTAKGRALARAMRRPELVVADSGHMSGRRLIDYVRFADPTTPPAAVLVEAGQHWLGETVHVAAASVAGLLSHVGVTDARPPAAGPGRFAAVTDVITANTAGFSFVQPYRGGDVIARRNTVIGIDGSTELRTPYDNCLLVMPSLRPSRGHTAVRLAHFIED